MLAGRRKAREMKRGLPSRPGSGSASWEARVSNLLRGSCSIRAGGTVDERLYDEVECLTKKFVDLRGEADAATVNAERHDILYKSR